METWMITGVTGFLGPRVEVTLRGKRRGGGFADDERRAEFHR